MAKRIVLNAFDMTCVSHQSAGTWRHPLSQASRYNDIDYWTNLARELERGHFDCLFIADVVGVYDVYRGSAGAALTDAAQVPVNDPFASLSAMAAVTSNLGFGITAAVTFEQPYILARRLSTLDHLSKGRIAWNVVSSYLNSAALNIGLEKQIGHDERYDMADEYMDRHVQAVGRALGKTARFNATRCRVSSPTPPRSTRSATKANTTSCLASTCASRRRSAHR